MDDSNLEDLNTPREDLPQPKKRGRIDVRRVEDRLLQLDSRLEKALAARDQYLDFMKSKYPEWQPPKTTTYRSRSTGPPQRHRPAHHNRHKARFFDDDDVLESSQYPRGQYPNYDASPSPPRPLPPRPSLLGRLETRQYFWNNNTSQHVRRPEAMRAQFLTVSEPIPSSQIVLDSDLPVMMSKLKEIKENLNNLREYRLSMPSVDYFKTIQPSLKVPDFNEKPSQDPQKTFYGDPRRADLPSLAEIRSRIMNMQFNIERRTREIIDESNRIRSMSAQSYMDRRAMPHGPYQNYASYPSPSNFPHFYGQTNHAPPQGYVNQMPNYGYPSPNFNFGLGVPENIPNFAPFPEQKYESRMERVRENMAQLRSQLFSQPSQPPEQNLPGQLPSWMGPEPPRQPPTFPEPSYGWLQPPVHITQPIYVPQNASQPYGGPHDGFRPENEPKIQPSTNQMPEKLVQNQPVAPSQPLEPQKDLQVKIPERRTINFGGGVAAELPRQEPTPKSSIQEPKAEPKLKEEVKIQPQKAKEPEESSYSKMLELLKPKSIVVSSSSDSDDEKIPVQKPSFLGSVNLGGGPSGSKSTEGAKSGSILKPSTSGLLGSSPSSNKPSPKKGGDDSDSDFFD